MTDKLDLILRNGKFWTGVRNHPFAGTVGVAGEMIALVSDKADEPLIADVEIDLQGQFAMPGFIDAHTHFRKGGESLRQLDLHSARNEKDFYELVRAFASSQPPDRWIIGNKWDNENWERSALPSKERIDRFTPGTPVFLDRIDTHTALVNSCALRLAGIDKGTSDPTGGVVVRDESGEPTGIVKDAAREIVLKVIPEISFEDRLLDAKSAVRHASSLGVTSAHDMSSKADVRLYERLLQSRELSVRLYSIPPLGRSQGLRDDGMKQDSNCRGDSWIESGATKAFADGSLGSGTASFFEPYYDDPSNYGIGTELLSSGKLEKLALEADRNHIQLAIHAIGDKAVSNVLDLFERISRENPDWDRRVRIEHAQHLREDDFSRFSRFHVVASVQPYHCIDDGRWAMSKIGAQRAERAFAFRKMLDENIVLAFGTDWPVAPLNPLYGIYAAVTRATIDGKNPDGWIPQQKITLEESLRAYTFGGAYASFSESEKGTIETGKLADIIVLSENPFEVMVDRLKDIETVLTIVGGKTVFGKGRFSEYLGQPAS